VAIFEIYGEDMEIAVVIFLLFYYFIILFYFIILPLTQLTVAE